MLGKKFIGNEDPRRNERLRSISYDGLSESLNAITFHIHSGLSNKPETVSFESVKFPGYFIVKQRKTVRLKKISDGGILARDATFELEKSEVCNQDERIIKPTTDQELVISVVANNVRLDPFKENSSSKQCAAFTDIKPTDLSTTTTTMTTSMPPTTSEECNKTLTGTG